MADISNKLSRFWQELKRRKVIKTMAGYAATAFILMEAADIMLPRLGLPEWTVTFLIVLLIAGFPIAVILSWIFDLTPEGIQKTENFQAVSEKPGEGEQTKRSLKLSDFIIVALLVVVCILLYPKIFNKDRFKDMRDDKGRIAVAVMPFENLSGDTLLNVWQGGLQNLMISTLSYSSQLEVRQYNTVSDLLSQKANVNHASIGHSTSSDLARSLNSRTFISGKILKAGNRIRVNAQLIDSETEEVYKTYQMDGSGEEDFFSMSDSLASMIRNYLEIKNLVNEFSSPIIQESTSTKSAEAFQYYIRGWDGMAKGDIRSTWEWLGKAIATDTGFIEAKVFLSFSYLPFGGYEQSKFWCDKAYLNRDVLPSRERLMVDHLHAYLYETPREEIRFCKQLLDLDEMSTPYWYFIGDAYYSLEQYEEAIPYFEKALEIHDNWGTYFTIPMLYYELGECYHLIGNHKRESEIYNLGLRLFQDDTKIIRQQATCALSTGHEELARQLLEHYRAVGEAFNMNESTILSNIGFCYWDADRLEEAEDYMRQGLALDPDNPVNLNNLAWLLIDEDLDVDEGLELVEKALEKIPDNSNFLDTRGWGLYKQGRYAEALESLRKSWDHRDLYSQVIADHMEAVEKALSGQ